MRLIHTISFFLIAAFALCFMGCADGNTIDLKTVSQKIAQQGQTSLAALQKNTQQGQNSLSTCIAHLVEDKHCEKTRVGKKSKVVIKLPQNFKGSVEFFMEALKTGNIDQAGKMSSEFGLVSFLQMDIDEVTSYQASNFQVNDVIGTAIIDINDLGSPRTFYFNLMNGVWTFVGSDYWNS